MPKRPDSEPKQFIQGAPVLHVPDVEATAKYYRDFLGFEWDFGNENYSVVWRDNSAIHLVKGSGRPAGLHLFQWVVDVDAYCREIEERGVEWVVAPGDRDYHIRDFTVRDPNGVELVFGQDILGVAPEPAGRLHGYAARRPRPSLINVRDIKGEQMSEKRIKLARLLVTAPAVFLALGPPLVDFNSSHVTNPLWTGHARLHTVWLIVTNSMIAILALGLMWRELKVASVRAGAILTAAPLVGFFIAAGTQSFYGGSFTDPNGVALRVGFLDANLAVFSLWMGVILVAISLVWKSDD